MRMLKRVRRITFERVRVNIEPRSVFPRIEPCVRACSLRTDRLECVPFVMSLEWSIESCLQLIDEYKKRPVLWNSKNEHYYSKHSKDAAWEEIAEKFNVDPQQAKQKMGSLLGSFRREKSRGKTRVVNNGSEYEIDCLRFSFCVFIAQIL